MNPDEEVALTEQVDLINQIPEVTGAFSPDEEEPAEVVQDDNSIHYDYEVSEEKLEEILHNVKNEIERADRYYEDELESDIIKRHKIFESDKDYYKNKFPKLSKVTDVTSSDFHDTVEWAMPSLIKVFFGSEDICKLQGANSESDDRAAQVLNDLIKYQLERHNDGFLIFYDWIKNALIDNLGICKCYWEREENTELLEVTCSSEQLMAIQNDPKNSILSVEQVSPDPSPEQLAMGIQYQAVYRVEYERLDSVIRNQPKLEVVPPNEFRFSPTARTLDDIDFVAHRKIVTLDYLKRREREGLYQRIDEVEENAGDQSSVSRTMYETDLNPSMYNQVESGNKEKAKSEYLLYECYVKTDVNDDGILEDIIVTIVDDIIIRLEENTMGRHPFFAISPIRDTLRLFPKRGIADLVGELQDLYTVLLRQIVYNIANNNDRQAFVNIDALVDPNEFIDGKKGVRVTGSPRDVVYFSPQEQLSSDTYTFLESIQSMKENRTGITRYNQGMDSSSLNKTATGITQIMQASNQRLELIARTFAETGVKQLFRHLIRMNQMYITEETFIRVTDKPKPIAPDDLAGEIDVTVNVGVAAGTKDQQFRNLQLLLQMYPQVLQTGIADNSHVAFCFQRLVETMGYKNVSDFSFNPDLIKEASMQGIPPQLLQMMHVAEQTGEVPPALQQAIDQQRQQQVAAAAGQMAQAKMAQMPNEVQSNEPSNTRPYPKKEQ